MSIRPENRKRYPKKWKLMVEMARVRSGNRCECRGQCGRDHPDGRCAAVHRGKHPETRSVVILTLAHFLGVPEEYEDISQMFHACQACHNRYDAPKRRAGIRARAFADQLEMFEGADLGTDPQAQREGAP